VEPREQFGANLRRARLAAGLSQEGLSQRCGLHLTEISRLENGLRDPRLSTIVRVSAGLALPSAALLDRVDEAHSAA
jgi:transcriptional regulator with XRE-family HTH domain